MCLGWSVITMAQGEWDEVVVFRIIFRERERKKESSAGDHKMKRPQLLFKQA